MSSGPSPVRWPQAAALVGCLLGTRALGAQTDFYNLDAGRPLRVEDALVVERHALEWQMAPIKLLGARGAPSAWSIEPEIAWGAWPRLQVEVGLPVQLSRSADATRGVSGLDVSALYALNAESRTWPALAVSVGSLLPVGRLAADRAFTEVRGIATRTMTHGRLHLNVAMTPGPRATSAPDDVTRWRAGLAADHVFALRSTLVGAEVTAEEPLVGGGVQWTAGAGVRYQVGPRSAVDLGLGRRFRNTNEWYVTMGSAVSFGLLHRFGGVR